MDNQLDDILSGTDEPVAAVETPAAPEATTEAPPAAEAPPPAAERPRGPDGKFLPKDQPAETPAADPPLDHPALLGERRRRQELEQQLRELQERVAPQQTQAAPQAQDAPPDRWEDPDGYDRWLVAQAAKAARAEATQTFQIQRIETSANAFKATVPDYDEKLAVFGQMLEANPALLNELYRAPNPAEYAYNMGKTQTEIAQYGGIDGVVQARVQEALKTAQPTAQPIPTTLAGEQSLRGSSAGYEPPSLEEILGR